MTVPKAYSTEQDGGLGMRAALSGLPMAVVGQAVAGDINTPISYTRGKDIIAAHTDGRAVQAAAYACEHFGKRIVFVRCATSVAHAYSALDDADFAGTSAVTLDVAPEPNEDYDVIIEFPAGGTIAAPGITYKYSLDGGRTYSPVLALGTANTIILPDTGGVNVDFAAGTVVAGDILRFTATAETFNAADLTAALTALGDTSLPWEFFQVCGDLDATTLASATSALNTMHTAGKHHWGIGHFRMPTAGESEATYLAAWNTAFSAAADSDMSVSAGAVKMSSSVKRNVPRKPPSVPVAALVASLSEEISAAEIDQGRLPNVTLRDSNGNVEVGFHDEAVNPGLDDARALTVRTHDGETGVYCNLPRMLSAAGSDFDLIMKRRVMNLARTICDRFMRRRLQKVLKVNPSTSFVAEAELLAIETSLNALLARELKAKPKVSDVRVVLSLDDDILVTKKLTGQLRLVPLGYPEEIEIEASWALTLPAAA